MNEWLSGLLAGGLLVLPGGDGLRPPRKSPAQVWEEGVQGIPPGGLPRAKKLEDLVRAGTRLGHYAQALEHCQELLRIAEGSGDGRLRVRALKHRARIFKYLAQYEAAVADLQAAKALAESIAYLEGVADAHAEMGLVYRRMSDFALAAEELERAAGLFERQGLTSDLPSVLNNLGLVHLDMEDLDRAEHFFRLGLEHYRRHPKAGERVEGALLENQASVLRLRGRYKEALAFARRALDIALRHSDRKSIGNSRIDLAACLLRLGRAAEARRHLVQALAMKGEDQERYGRIAAQVVLGEVELSLGRTEAAESLLREAAAGARAIQARRYEGEAHRVLSLLEERRGRPERALEYERRRMEIQDLNNRETLSRRRAELRTALDVERKEGELALLRRDGQIRALELARQRTQRNLLLLAGAGALALAAVLYARYRFSVRMNRRLRESEANLEDLRAHLAELVEIRTRALEEAQRELVQRERLAVLGQLTATVAHEIRNPLGSIRSSIFSAGRALENGHQVRIPEALALAERNVMRCDRIVRDLLDYGRRRVLELRDVAVDPWLEELLREVVVPPGLTLERELRAEGRIVRMDEARVRRALLNLVTNAFEAVDGSPGAWVRIVTQSRGEDLEMTVLDSGPGIPESLRDRVFEPLFTTKPFGFGLGLAVVADVVEEHGGTVTLHCHAGSGALIRLTLPCAGPASDEPGLHGQEDRLGAGAH